MIEDLERSIGLLLKRIDASDHTDAGAATLSAAVRDLVEARAWYIDPGQAHGGHGARGH